MTTDSEQTIERPATGNRLEPVVLRLWFIVVLHPARGWMRAGRAYANQQTAKGWVSFVRKAWRGCRTKVAPCVLRVENGTLTEESKRELSEMFNMDPPTPEQLAAILKQNNVLSVSGERKETND